MNSTTKILLIILLTCTLAGCVSSSYLTDRGRDLADIFTATVGIGAGAKARVGPVMVPLYYSLEFGGLKSGEFFTGFANVHVPTEFWLLFFKSPWEYGEIWSPQESNKSRCKDIYAKSDFPFLLTDVQSTYKKSEAKSMWSHPYTYQIEASGGFLGTLRLGFNPAELLDFLLGWTTLDLFGDDIGVVKEEEKEEEETQ